MSALDAKNIAGFEPVGVDPNGLWMFFGFTLENNPRTILHCNYPTLGKVILYLKDLAREAQRRRLEVDATAKDLEVQEIKANPVVRADFDVDVAGDSARLLCTTAAGIDYDLQLSYELLGKLHQSLPGLLEEMRKRQKAHEHRH